MDYDVSSAAYIVPRLHEKISTGLSSFKEKFLLDTKHSPVSPLFQNVCEVPPSDIIDFHHQEEVVTTTSTTCPLSPPSSTRLSMDDLDAIDANDLFSFSLDNNSYNGQIPELKRQDSLLSAFDTLPCTNDAPTTPGFDVPFDLLDLLELPFMEGEEVETTKASHRTKSNSSSSTSGPSVVLNMSPDETSFSSDGENEDFDVHRMEDDPAESYFSGDDEYVERAMPKSRRGGIKIDSSVYLHNEDLANGKPGQRLVLTAEEKRLLVQMGVRVPTTFPLTRAEERSIRTMRRKIRNKISAKASRARRQVYLSSLESRVVDCHKENQRLKNRIIDLEKDKKGLLANLRQMRSYMARIISGTGMTGKLQGQTTTPLLPLTVTPPPHRRGGANRVARGSGGFSKSSTSLLVVAMMILASSSIFPLPDMLDPSSAKNEQQIADAAANALSGRSRTLLNAAELAELVAIGEGSSAAVAVSTKSESEDANPLTPSLSPPAFESPMASNDSDDDGIPVIMSKLRPPDQVNKPPFLEVKFKDNVDPFLQKSALEQENGFRKQEDVSPSYSLEDL